MSYKVKSNCNNILNVDIVETESRICVVSDFNNKKQQEDTKNLSTAGSVNIYSVFDGHGWDKSEKKGVANHTSKMLESELVRKIISDIYPVLDSKNESLVRLRQSILDYDRELYDRTIIDQDGSTGVLVIQDGENLYLANLGDSRAIVFDRNTIKYETTDHKPDQPYEKERIILAGGQSNLPKGKRGVSRVNIKGRDKGLAVSRGFGDFRWKIGRDKLNPVYQGTNSIVSPEPDIAHVFAHAGDYIVLASDGLWDVLSSEEVRIIALGGNFEKICEKLTQEAINRGSRDNITVVAVKLKYI